MLPLFFSHVEVLAQWDNVAGLVLHVCSKILLAVIMLAAPPTTESSPVFSVKMNAEIGNGAQRRLATFPVLYRIILIIRACKLGSWP
jgi:hypothetical protein